MSGGNETSMKRVFDALGWVGVLLVVAAVLIRFTRPELETWWWRLAMAGLVVVLIYLATQWRELLALLKQRSARAGTRSSARVPGSRCVRRTTIPLATPW